MQETHTKHQRRGPAIDDLLTVWVIAAVIAATTGVLLWSLRV